MSVKSGCSLEAGTLTRFAGDVLHVLGVLGAEHDASSFPTPATHIVLDSVEGLHGRSLGGALGVVRAVGEVEAKGLESSSAVGRAAGESSREAAHLKHVLVVFRVRGGVFIRVGVLVDFKVEGRNGRNGRIGPARGRDGRGGRGGRRRRRRKRGKEVVLGFLLHCLCGKLLLNLFLGAGLSAGVKHGLDVLEGSVV